MTLNKDTHGKSIIKSAIWRVVGVLTLGVITYLYTGSWVKTGWITFLHHGTFLIVFYLHERFWQHVDIKSMLARSLLKCLTYETILGNFILGIITLIITGDIQQMTQITLTYIGIKHLMYIFNEFLWKDKTKEKIVYAYVVGDILHIGHIRHLERAKKQGDYLIVGVLTDEATMEKKPRPTIPLIERFEMVRNLKMVDRVVEQDTYSPSRNVSKISPDVLMESESHDPEDIKRMIRLVSGYGGKVIVSPYYLEQSSTKIKKKVWKKRKQDL